MRHVLIALLLVATVTAADTIPATGGDITITTLIHSSVQIEHAGKVIQIDPWSVGDLSQAKPADLILITDDVGHHLDVKAIAEVAQTRCARLHARERPEAHSRRHRPRQRRNGDGAGHRHRVDRGLRHQAGRAGASQGRGQRLLDHPRRQADYCRWRHRVRAGGARAEEHRRRVHADEHPGRIG